MVGKLLLSLVIKSLALSLFRLFTIFSISLIFQNMILDGPRAFQFTKIFSNRSLQKCFQIKCPWKTGTLASSLPGVSVSLCSARPLLLTPAALFPLLTHNLQTFFFILPLFCFQDSNLSFATCLIFSVWVMELDSPCSTNVNIRIWFLWTICFLKEFSHILY